MGLQQSETRSVSRGLHLAVAAWTFFASGRADADAPVFKVTPVHRFSGADGASPSGNLVEGEDGVFYGTTGSGGSRGGGTVFRITSKGELKTLFDFGQEEEALEGSAPITGVIRIQDGFLYGTTSLRGDLGQGIAGGGGTVFRIDPEGTLSVLETFVGTNGAQPSALTLGSDGFLYGLTSAGSDSAGVLFKVTPSGSVSSLHAFNSDDSEGAWFNSLIDAPDGYLYGTSTHGGSKFGGVVFRASHDGQVTVLHEFQTYGSPEGLVMASNGSLYGVASGDNILFSITRDGAFQSLHRFGCSCGLPEGAYPNSISLANDGTIYGTTVGGGTNNEGTIFTAGLDGSVTPLYSFGDYVRGTPYGALIEGRDGRFYGTTRSFQDGGSVYKLTFLPRTPLNVAASAGTSRATITWDEVKSANDYVIYQAKGTDLFPTTPVLTGVSGTQAEITGLMNGVTYRFKVAAENEAGIGASSEEHSVFPVAPPTNLQATSANSKVILTWTAAEGASSYNIYQSTGAIDLDTPTLTGITANSIEITPLVNGTKYFFKVASVYGDKQGLQTEEVSATPASPSSSSTSTSVQHRGGGGSCDELLAILLSLLLTGDRILRRTGRPRVER